MKAAEFAQRAADLIGGDRNRQHGDARKNHNNIAALWNGYLQRRFGGNHLIALNAHDVMLMMVLLKVARTLAGSHNPDDYTDMVGYAALAGGDAEQTAALADRIVAAEPSPPPIGRLVPRT